MACASVSPPTLFRSTRWPSPNSPCSSSSQLRIRVAPDLGNRTVGLWR
jgi:hypothetical protein